ncbi:MAG: hypothetical protein ACTS6H_01580 [Candidatus Hodgkinia cicadicola]
MRWVRYLLGTPPLLVHDASLPSIKNGGGGATASIRTTRKQRRRRTVPFNAPRLTLSPPTDSRLSPQRSLPRRSWHVRLRSLPSRDSWFVSTTPRAQLQPKWLTYLSDRLLRLVESEASSFNERQGGREGKVYASPPPAEEAAKWNWKKEGTKERGSSVSLDWRRNLRRFRSFVNVVFPLFFFLSCSIRSLRYFPFYLRSLRRRKRCEANGVRSSDGCGLRPSFEGPLT